MVEQAIRLCEAELITPFCLTMPEGHHCPLPSKVPLDMTFLHDEISTHGSLNVLCRNEPSIQHCALLTSSALSGQKGRACAGCMAHAERNLLAIVWESGRCFLVGETLAEGGPAADLRNRRWQWDAGQRYTGFSAAGESSKHCCIDGSS